VISPVLAFTGKCCRRFPATCTTSGCSTTTPVSRF
jgi:hypothetical protein